METHHTIAAELQELAGNVRTLAYLMRPAPNLPDMERGPLITMLELIAADLDRVAQKTETCRVCPHNIAEARP